MKATYDEDAVEIAGITAKDLELTLLYIKLVDKTVPDFERTGSNFEEVLLWIKMRSNNIACFLRNCS